MGWHDESWDQYLHLFLFVSLLLCMSGYFCMRWTWYVSVAFLKMCWALVRKQPPGQEFKEFRLVLWRQLFTGIKSLMFVFFCYIYYVRDSFVYSIPAVDVIANVLLLLVGVGWFFDIYITNFLNEERLREESPTQGYWWRTRTDSHHERKRVLFRAVGRLAFWVPPSDDAAQEVERLMTDRCIRIVLCWKGSTVSLKMYLMVFTVFHLCVVSFNLAATAVAHKQQQFLEVYCMFPLGVFLGEKMICMLTGFTPWYNEYRLAKKHRGTMSANIGLAINIFDFLMLFYSIIDDCFGQSTFVFGHVANMFSFVCVMMLVDDLFDLYAVGGAVLENRDDASSRKCRLLPET